MTRPVLTIAIPTWNRAQFLERTLAQLRGEMATVPPNTIELVVSDNASTDDTPAVVAEFNRIGPPVRYVRNDENIGWGGNFAQCFQLARGQYVLLLGDDDLLVDGALALILEHLGRATYGVVCLRPYGFDDDFREEFPGRFGGVRSFEDPNAFLLSIGALMTMISSMVINKDLLHDVDPQRYRAGDLAALPLVVTAALRGRRNLFLAQYLVACKRNNSSNYEFGSVFVTQWWGIMDDHIAEGLDPATLRRLESQVLFSHYPHYLFALRRARVTTRMITLEHFDRRFRGRWLFHVWVAPTLLLPRPLALVWGAVTTVVGRALGGDLRRGIKFQWYKLTKFRRARAMTGANA